MVSTRTDAHTHKGTGKQEDIHPYRKLIGRSQHQPSEIPQTAYFHSHAPRAGKTPISNRHNLESISKNIATYRYGRVMGKNNMVALKETISNKKSPVDGNRSLYIGMSCLPCAQIFCCSYVVICGSQKNSERS